MQAFSEALGKYKLYIHALKQSEGHQDRKLFIATSIQGYYRLKDVEFIRDMLADESIALIVIDINKKIITGIV